MLGAGAHVALVNSSNACPPHERAMVPELVRYLEGVGLRVSLAAWLPRKAAGDGAGAGAGEGADGRPWDWAHVASDHERADSLMTAFADPEVEAIFDISGGDLANGVLKYLDWDLIRANPKPYAGYSDLSTHLNAFFVETGMPQIYWRILPLGGSRVGEAPPAGVGPGESVAAEPRPGRWGVGYGDVRERFEATFLSGGGIPTEISNSSEGAGGAAGVGAADPRSLFHLDDIRFVRGESMAGTLVGGNIRCTLKLAGTRWFPDLDGTILALESESNTAPLLTTLLTQYQDMGAFERCAGILIGQQNNLTHTSGPHAIEQILDAVVDTDIPIARTEQFGHLHNSRALVVGARYELEASSGVGIPTEIGNSRAEG